MAWDGLPACHRRVGRAVEIGDRPPCLLHEGGRVDDWQQIQSMPVIPPPLPPQQTSE